MTQPGCVLQQLLGDIPTESFVKQQYLRLPFARPGGCTDLISHANWDVVDRLLRQSASDVIVGHQGQAVPEARPRNAREAQDWMHRGQTIGIRHAQENDQQLAELARRFQHALCADVDIHLYCTSGGQPGFGWHYDAEEVFVLQTVGGKEWHLRKNTVNPWPLIDAIPANQRYEREIMPVLRCQLLAGDWLYIPNGYWHATCAAEDSVSLSIGIRALTAMDVYDFLRRMLPESILWRQRLPPLGTASSQSDEERLTEYRECFRGLADALAELVTSDHLIAAFLQAQLSRSARESVRRDRAMASDAATHH